MASRESQGLQIALILFVMVTVVLGVTTYMYFRKSEEKIKEADAAKAETKQKVDQLVGMENENQALKHMLGAEPKTKEQFEDLKKALASNAAMQNVITNFEQDMDRFGAGLQADRLNYRGLPEKLVTTLTELNAKVADTTTGMKLLEGKHAKDLEAERLRTAQAEDRFTKQAADYASARKIFNDERARVTTEKDNLAKQAANQAAETTRVTQKSQEDVEKLRTQLTNAMTLFDTARKKLRAREEESKFERPAGKIEWVNQGAKLVWINLGDADGVQRAMLFSVFDQNETGVTKAKVKGRIEVTRIIGPNQAEARIIAEDDSLKNPIMKDDMIYSPTFKKGEKMHVALVGTIDINNDGVSDRERLKSIIAMNNGIVDAELLEDGTVAGKMTMDTRFLIQGQKPDEKTNPKLTKGYTDMIGEATRLGIDMMTLKAFLDRMGYSGEQRVTPLTRGGAGGASPKAEKFRPRSPGKAY